MSRTSIATLRSKRRAISASIAGARWGKSARRASRRARRVRSEGAGIARHLGACGVQLPGIQDGDFGVAQEVLAVERQNGWDAVNSHCGNEPRVMRVLALDVELAN